MWGWKRDTPPLNPKEQQELIDAGKLRREESPFRLQDADGGKPVERTTDGFGFTWLTCRQDPGSVTDLVTELHAVNRSLEEQGFGPSLLCSVVGFADASGRPLGLVYLYKRGSFYPFAPLGGERRDNSLELQARGLIASDVPLEPELGRWMALWGAPGLS